MQRVDTSRGFQRLQHVSKRKRSAAETVRSVQAGTLAGMAATKESTSKPTQSEGNTLDLTANQSMRNGWRRGAPGGWQQWSAATEVEAAKMKVAVWQS